MSIYLPKHFGVADAAERDALARDVIDRFPFATLVGQHEGVPFVTHCPLTAQPKDPAASAQGPDPAFVVEGHVARANPHWRAWQADGASALAIFHGSHAYVSPTLYSAPENVPTWNYVVVHVAGSVTVVDDVDDKHALIKRLISRVEPAYEAQWNALDDAYQHRMLGAIVGFRITPERIDAKFKVSQNRLPVDRERVRDAFETGTEAQRDLAQWMRRLGA